LRCIIATTNTEYFKDLKLIFSLLFYDYLTRTLTYDYLAKLFSYLLYHAYRYSIILLMLEYGANEKQQRQIESETKIVYRFLPFSVSFFSS